MVNLGLVLSNNGHVINIDRENDMCILSLVHPYSIVTFHFGEAHLLEHTVKLLVPLSVGICDVCNTIFLFLFCYLMGTVDRLRIVHIFAYITVASKWHSSAVSGSLDFILTALVPGMYLLLYYC